MSGPWWCLLAFDETLRYYVSCRFWPMHGVIVNSL